MAKIIAGIEFDNEVLKSDVPVMVDFYATWCMPCQMIAPAIDELSAEMSGKAKVVKLDIDEAGASDVIVKYNIRSVPTLMFFKDGQAVDMIVGAAPKTTMTDKINGLI